MERKFSDEKWVCSDHVEEDEDDHEDEALSLCDLPTNEETVELRENSGQIEKVLEDFDFGSHGGALSTEYKMCSADEVFFRGKILPLRHSASSTEKESGLSPSSQNDRVNGRTIARSESMGHFHPGGFSTLGSRSSSISSLNSSSSSSNSNTPSRACHNPKTRNQFHSYPSPNPQIRIPNLRNPSRPSTKSTIWSFFHVGLLKPPQIGLADLKIRSKSTTLNRFGSHGSSNGSSTCSSAGAAGGKKQKEGLIRAEKRKKYRFLDQNGGVLSGGCTCTVETVPLNVIVNSNEAKMREERERLLKKTKKTTATTATEQGNENQGKQAASRRRTFEWLKQLSLLEEDDAFP